MFKGDYLRVKKPLTSNGVNLKLVGDRLQFKTVNLPIHAKYDIDLHNQSLPESLRWQYEIISPDPIMLPKPESKKPEVDLEKEKMAKELEEMRLEMIEMRKFIKAQKTEKKVVDKPAVTEPGAISTPESVAATTDNNNDSEI